MGYDRVLVAMQEQDRWVAAAGIPFWMWVAAAGDHASERQVATSVEGHGSSLGETEQNGLAECGFSAVKREQSLAESVNGRWHGIPLGREQAVPLASGSLGMGLWSVQGHNIKGRVMQPSERFAKGFQVVGIGPPAV